MCGGEACWGSEMSAASSLSVTLEGETKKKAGAGGGGAEGADGGGEHLCLASLAVAVCVGG